MQHDAGDAACFDVGGGRPPRRQAADSSLETGPILAMPRRERPLSMAAAARVAVIMDANSTCDKPWSLRPRDPATLQALLETVHRYYERAAPDSTLGTEASNWRWWLRYTCCPRLWAVPCVAVRPDKRQLTFSEQLLEEAMWAGAVPWIHLRMANKAGVVGAAKPSSVINVLRGVRRAHLRQQIDTVSLQAAVRACQGLMREYVEIHGADALLPHRREPLTNKHIKALLAMPEGTYLTPRKRLKWAESSHRSLRAIYATLAQTGMRKGEVSLASGVDFGRMHLALKNVRWLIGGAIYEAPTTAQLRSLAHGDYALLTPPCSKADQFSLHWGASTIYLAFYESEADHPICAARELAREELRRLVPADKRADVPLFVRAGNSPWRHGQLSDAFSEMMGVVCGGAEAAKPYSVHSFRVYLACALLSAGASSGTIQTMLRWRSDDALRIYARINDYKYAEWLDRAAVATVSSVRTTTQAVVQRMELAATGPVACAEAGFQAHWQEAAAAAESDFAGMSPPVHTADVAVEGFRTDAAVLMAHAERADAADAAEFGIAAG